jgi:hypothetical protein
MNRDSIILYIPGMSGLQDTARLEYMRDMIHRSGFEFDPIPLWKDKKELETKSINSILEIIETYVEQNINNILRYILLRKVSAEV